VESFIPEEFWTLEGSFKKGKTAFNAQLALYKGEKPTLKNEREVQAIIDVLHGKEAAVTDVKSTQKTIHPKPPFTTSTMQQTAANRLGFTSRKTMQIAQQLYEGIAVGSSRVGY